MDPATAAVKVKLAASKKQVADLTERLRVTRDTMNYKKREVKYLYRMLSQSTKTVAGLGAQV